MSTSPEAKQAAEKWGSQFVQTQILEQHKQYYAKGYDAATAKPREELEAKNETIGVALEIGRRLGKAGVDFDKMTKEQWSKIFRDHIDELIKENESLRRQLAHQQPSVDFRQPDETRWPGYGKDFRAKPSAPTPDVEKIAREVNESTGDDILSMVMDFQNGRVTASQLMDRIAARCEAFAAQARAPLVAALEFYANPETYHACLFTFDPPTGGWDTDFELEHGHPNYDRAMPGKRARAVLTGTGEKSPNVFKVGQGL